jgi:hypothetical protein
VITCFVIVALHECDSWKTFAAIRGDNEPRLVLRRLWRLVFRVSYLIVEEADGEIVVLVICVGLVSNDGDGLPGWVKSA